MMTIMMMEVMATMMMIMSRMMMLLPFFMNPHAEEAHGGNDDDDDDDDDDDGEIYFTGKRCSGRSLARHRWWYLSVHYKQRLLRGCPCAIKDAKPVKQNDKHHRRQAKSQFSYVL